MEYKRDIDGAGLGDPDDGHDSKRVRLPLMDDLSQFSSQYWGQAVGDAGRSTELQWMQPNDEHLLPNIDQLPEPDADFGQIFASSIDEQQSMNWSVTNDSPHQSSIVDPSPTPATEESKAYVGDRGSEAREVNACFGVVRILQGHAGIPDSDRR